MAKRRKSSTAPAQLEEVADFESEEPQKGLDLETALIFVTFLALVIGVVVAQLALKKYFDAGMLA